MALAPTPLASPNQRRSKYLAEALKSMRAEPERIGGYGDLAARLAAQYLTQRASEKTDEAVGVEESNARVARRQALFGGIEGLDVGGEMQAVPSSRLDNPIAGALRMIGGNRGEQQAPSAPSRPAPEFNVMQRPAAPAGDVQGRPLPQIGMMSQDGGQDPRVGPVSPAPAQPAPMQANPNQIPPEIVQQAQRFLALGTPEGEQEALKLVQGWQQQQAMLAQMPLEIRNDPVLRYAFMQNPEAVAESIGYQYRPQVIAAGGIQSVIGSGDRVSAPQTIQFGDTLTRVDPLSPTPQTIATRGPTIAEQIDIEKLRQPQPVAVGEGQMLTAFDPQNRTATPLIERDRADRPLSASEQQAIDNLEIDLTFGEQALGNVRSVIADIDSGAFRLDPAARAAYGLRNSTGQSSPQSRAFASARTTVSNLRNTLLRENKGTQTEGDAIRILEEVIANWGDERIVRQGLQQFEQLYGQIQRDRTGQLERRRSGESRRVGGPQGGPVSVSTEEEYRRLPSGTRYVAPDGQVRTKQ